jgi:hypothetical protein
MKLTRAGVALLVALAFVGSAVAEVKRNQRAPTMKANGRILVVHYSRSGNTERVAKDIAARRGADIEQIVDLRDRRGFTGFLGGVCDSVRKVSAHIAAPRPA